MGQRLCVSNKLSVVTDRISFSVPSVGDMGLLIIPQLCLSCSELHAFLKQMLRLTSNSRRYIRVPQHMVDYHLRSVSHRTFSNIFFLGCIWSMFFSDPVPHCPTFHSCLVPEYLPTLAITDFSLIIAHSYFFFKAWPFKSGVVEKSFDSTDNLIVKFRWLPAEAHTPLQISGRYCVSITPKPPSPSLQFSQTLWAYLTIFITEKHYHWTHHVCYEYTSINSPWALSRILCQENYSDAFPQNYSP